MVTREGKEPKRVVVVCGFGEDAGLKCFVSVEMTGFFRVLVGWIGVGLSAPERRLAEVRNASGARNIVPPREVLGVGLGP
jgi:hypothetical protein